MNRKGLSKSRHSAEGKEFFTGKPGNVNSQPDAMFSFKLIKDFGK